MPEEIDKFTHAELPEPPELEVLLLEIDSGPTTRSARSRALRAGPQPLNAYGFSRVFEDMFTRILEVELEQWIFDAACERASALVERFAAVMCSDEPVLRWALGLARPSMPDPWHREQADSFVVVLPGERQRSDLQGVETSPWCESAVKVAIDQAGENRNWSGHATLLASMIYEYERVLMWIGLSAGAARGAARANVQQWSLSTCPEPIVRAMALRELDLRLGNEPLG